MSSTIASHYSNDRLLEAIKIGIDNLGIASEALTVDDLAPVDEFHIGGRTATAAFIDQLAYTEAQHLLDIGCGLGGTARYVASRYGSQVTGIDLSPDFLEAGNTMCGWVGLADRIELLQASALNMPFDSAHFDGAYMLHVGMNIADKARLFQEVNRVLKPGATFGVYDIVRLNDEDLSYPVPWASNAAMNHAGRIQDYEAAFLQSGFQLIKSRDRREFAQTFYNQMRAVAEKRQEPPALGLHLLMGSSTKEKLANMINGLNRGLIAPVEFIARKIE